MIKISEKKLEDVTGGMETDFGGWKKVKANVTYSFLPLRSQTCCDDKNVIAQIQDGEAFRVNDDIWQGEYVRASFEGLEGWVNADYLLWY